MTQKFILSFSHKILDIYEKSARSAAADLVVDLGKDQIVDIARRLRGGEEQIQRHHFHLLHSNPG